MELCETVACAVPVGTSGAIVCCPSEGAKAVQSLGSRDVGAVGTLPVVQLRIFES